MLKMKLEPHHIVLFDFAENLTKVLVQSRYQLFDFFRIDSFKFDQPPSYYPQKLLETLAQNQVLEPTFEERLLQQHSKQY